MNPIRIIPFKYTSQSMCPQCFGGLEPYKFSRKQKGVFRCKECGQLYCHPNNIVDEDNPDVVYVTARFYFKYKHLKNCIIHIACDMKTKKIFSSIRCNVDGLVYELDANMSAMREFFEEDNITKIMRLDASGYSATMSREVLNLNISYQRITREFHTNLEIIEIMPNIDILLSIILEVGHRMTATIHENHVFKLDVVR